MKVLIISPHFPPVNAADMQRVRLLLPHLAEAGILAEVLAVEAGQVNSPLDPWLLDGLPCQIPVHRVKALELNWGRLPGLGTLSFRALRALRKRGSELLRRSQKLELGCKKSGFDTGRVGFDLVYFSTTQFGLHVLGPEWKHKFGVPYVIDYQDPWVSDYYRKHPEVVPPGGRLKYAVSSWISRRQEPRVLRHCSGITSVSAAYPRQLQARYPWLVVSGEKQRYEKQKAETTPLLGGGGQQSGAAGIGCADLPPEGGTSAFCLSTVDFVCSTLDINHLIIASADAQNSAAASSTIASDRHRLPSLVIPFPGDQRDLDRVPVDGTRQGVFDPNDGLIHWVYIGVCPPPMDLTLAAYFLALGHWLSEHDDIRKSLRIHFVGTSYAKAGTGKSNVIKLARAAGVDDVVDEQTDRIPYSQTLRCLLDAGALIVLGTDDPGYTASKIYPYLLAEKPLLTVFHEESSVVKLIREVDGAVVVPFSTGEPVAAVAERIRREWLENERFRNPLPLDKEAFEPYTARVQAGQLAAFFRKCLEK
jgi:hypothetical protein